MRTICTLCLMVGAAGLVADDQSKPHPTAAAEQAKPADADKSAAAFDAEKLLGTWKLTEGKKNGEAIDDAAKQGLYLIKKDKIHIQANAGEDMFVIEYTLDPKAKPTAIDMKIVKSPGDSANGSKALGIIQLDGDTLKLTYDPSGEKRPEKFDDDKMYCFTLKREKRVEK